jgi:hypothetical protein
MSYKQCPFCGEKNIQRGYGIDLGSVAQIANIGSEEILASSNGIQDFMKKNKRITSKSRRRSAAVC